MGLKEPRGYLGKALQAEGTATGLVAAWGVLSW